MENIKYYNTFVGESIKHLLKPRSKEEIKKLLDKSVEELINMAYLKKIDWLLVYTLKNGAKLKDIKYANISTSKQELQEWVYKIFIKACEENDIELVKILLNDDIFSPIGKYFLYSSSSVPLVIAYKKGNYDIVKLLFNDKRIRKVLSDKEIIFLEEKMPELFEQNESIKHLLKPKSKDEILKNVFDNKEMTLNDMMLNGCKFGILEIVKYAISQGADPTITYDWPIRLAADYNNTEVIKYLLTFNEVDPSAIDNSVFKLACKHNNIELVKILLKDNRVDPTDNIIWNLKNLKILKNYSLIWFLLKDDRIKNSLSTEQYEYFIEFLKKKPIYRLKN